MVSSTNTRGKAGSNGTGDLGFEAKLWLAADKLRGNLDAAEYKHVMLGLIFLKYISDAFQERRKHLLEQPGTDPVGCLPGRGSRHPQKNVAVELLHKLLNDEIQHRSRRELVRSRTFSIMLEEAIRRYQNRAIQAAEVIERLIQLAKDIRESRQRGEELGLTGYEMAFYEALEVNDSAVKVLGDETLRDIARELVRQVRQSVSVDWTIKESARAKLRNMVRAILNQYGYPPDKQKMAVDLVLEQATELSDEWAAQPSVVDMRLRYTALLQKKSDAGLALPEQREFRELERELGELGELDLGDRPRQELRAAERPAEWMS